MTDKLARKESGLGMLRSDPFEEMRRFRGLFDSMMDGFFEPSAPLGSWSPAMNLYRDGDAMVAEMALPGVRKEDVEVRLEGSLLTISGRTHSEKEVRDEDMLRKEMYSGQFTRSVRLPQAVKADGVKAECKDGVLRVRLPLQEQPKDAHRIEVE